MSIEVSLKTNRLYVDPVVSVSGGSMVKVFKEHSTLVMYEFLYGQGVGRIVIEITSQQSKIPSALIIQLCKDDIKKIDYAVKNSY